MTWADVVAIAQKWPEVVTATAYAEPALKVRRHLLARHRIGDDSLVLLDVPADERAHLIEMMPESFFCEPHYDGYDIVLAKLANAPTDTVTRLLFRRWRNRASRAAVRQFKA